MKLKFLFLLFPLIGLSQIGGGLPKVPQLPQVIPPSPTVANLMHFEEVPVDLYTGQPDISIPLVNKQLTGGQSFSLALKYNTMGVRIHERSGWTGTGWSLEAGGVISRTIRGIADEKIRTNEDISTGIFHLDDYWNFLNLSTEGKNGFGWNVLGTSDEKYDSEPDLYQFSMLGMSGRFIIVKENGVLVAKQLNLDQKYDIYISYNQETYAINGFRITDANGIKYWFGNDANAIETSTSQPYSIVRYLSTSAEPGNAAPTLGLKPTTNITAFHLTQVTLNGEDLINFKYMPVIETYQSPNSRTEYTLENRAPFEDWLLHPYSYGQFRPMTVNSYYIITTNTKKISEIEFKDGTLLKFILGNFTHPENNGKVLEQIKYIRKTGVGTSALEEPINIYKLNYSISNGTDEDDENERVWLMSVDMGDDLFYNLNYFEREDLPGVNGPADSWSYNNGDFRNTMDYGYNFYDFNAFKRGLLTSITYPTGGTKNFYFEPHSFAYQSPDFYHDVSAYIDDFDSNPYNSDVQLFAQYFHANQNGTPSQGYSISFTHAQTINISKNILPQSAVQNSGDFEVVFTRSTPSGPEEKTVRFDSLPKLYGMAAGNYTVKVRIRPDLMLADNGDLYCYININYMKKKTGSAYVYSLLGGGARINAIEFTEPINGVNTTKRRFIYKYYTKEHDSIFNQDHNVSSGVADARIGNLLREYELTDKKWLYQSGVNGTVAGYRDIKYNVKTNELNANISKGNYVSYKNVKVFEGSDVFVGSIPANGYTEYFYSSAYEFPSDYFTINYPYQPQSDVDFKRGLLQKKIVYNSDGNPLEEVYNDYRYVENPIGNSIFVWERPCIWNQFFDSWEDYMEPQISNGRGFPCGPEGSIPGDCFEGGVQNCGPGAVNLKIINWFANRAELTESIKTEYFYKDGIVSSTETKTTYDYNIENYQLKEQIDFVKERNSIDEYKTTYQYPVGGYDTSLFNTDNDLNEIAAVDLLVASNVLNKPLVISSFKNDAPLQKIVNKYKFDTHWGTIPQIKEAEVSKENYPLENRIYYHAYDIMGNVLKASTPEGMFVYYIWGYDGTLPVAKIETADDYTFYGSTASILETLSGPIHTASAYETYNEGNLITHLNTLRSQLPNAMVTTFIHKRGVGVKTVTDPRGITMTYEYDEQNRLKWVKDHQGNLVSEHKYHYRTQED